MLSHIYRMLRGVEVTEETLGFEAIREAIEGEGHFLGGSHTMEAMQRDHFYPKLADRLEPRTWEESGKTTMWQRANLKAKQILDSHHPVHIDPAVENKIRQHYKILLP
jgi:trimethylamine--corrinoid protein Co-methyltransferase